MENRYGKIDMVEKVKFVKHIIVYCNSSSDTEKILRAETFCFITPTMIGSEAMTEQSTNTVTDANTILITVHLYQMNSQFAQVL